MRHLFFIFSFFMAVTGATGQVVIGSDLKYERAAILTLKDQEPNAQNATATQGGLLLPRVALVNLNTLEPLVKTTDIAWTDATQKEALLKEHMGLEVYNVTDNATLKPGTYVWNGTLWERLFKTIVPKVPNRLVFPLPAFNLPLVDPANSDNKRLRIDLYQIYANNRKAVNFITNMPNKGSFIRANTYKADELDYVVTHYDQDIITIHSLSNTGVLDYTVHNINPGPSSFLTIYLVVHEGKEKK